MEKKYCVYMHTLPNGKVYIGVTSQKPEHRWQSGKGYVGNEYFYRAILKYGWNNIRHDILFTELTKEEAALKEKELILTYRSNDRRYGYNILEGGFNNFDNVKHQLLPSYDEVLRNPRYMYLFKELLKMSYPQKVIETISTEEYNDKGQIVNIKVEEVERIVEPNMVALNDLIESYEDDPRLKEIIDKLKQIRAMCEEDVS